MPTVQGIQPHESASRAEAALRKIAAALRRAGAVLPIPQTMGEESYPEALRDGLSIALSVVEVNAEDAGVLL